jgi:predicted dehydrogenase
MWTGPAPLRPYDGIPHVRWWRTFQEYGNGIVGDMCIHMFDTARWMLGLGWPKRVSSTGGIFVQKEGKSNISDTQTATFEYDDLSVVWQHRTWGTPVDPKYPWALTLFGDKGTLKASVMSYDFIPEGKGDPIHKDCIYEREQFPEDVTEKEIELHAAPATRRHMLDFLAAIDKRGRPVADIEQGHISTASCILANLSMDLGGRPLVYDPRSKQVQGDEEANRRLRRPYRQPWRRPEA